MTPEEITKLAVEYAAEVTKDMARTLDESSCLLNYPKCYDMVMNYTNNGVTFREALRKVLAVNKLYLPDEQPPTLFDEFNKNTI